MTETVVVNLDDVPAMRRNAALAVGYRPDTAEFIDAEIVAGQLKLVVRGEEL